MRENIDRLLPIRALTRNLTQTLFGVLDNAPTLLSHLTRARLTFLILFNFKMFRIQMWGEMVHPK